VRLLAVQDDKAYIDALGFGVAAFNYLHRFVDPLLIKQATRGRPVAVDSRLCLSLALQYLNTPTREKTLAQIYGITPSTVNKYLAKTFAALRQILPLIPAARIKWPGQSKMAQLSSLVSRRCPGLDHVFAFVDGVRLFINKPDDDLIQNAYYSAAVSNHCINNVICFTTDGCICWARCNAAGAKQDSILCGPLYQLLEHHTPRPYRIISDTAFGSNRMRDRIITPFKEGERLSDNPNMRRLQLIMNSKITSTRQAVEWGNGALQRTFARLALPMSANEKKRQNIIIVVCHLFNLRTRLTGFNQIRTVYCDD